jgi:hypothetical protein
VTVIVLELVSPMAIVFVFVKVTEAPGLIVTPLTVPSMSPNAGSESSMLTKYNGSAGTGFGNIGGDAGHSVIWFVTVYWNVTTWPPQTSSTGSPFKRAFLTTVISPPALVPSTKTEAIVGKPADHLGS